MARYLISFNDGDMTFPQDDLPAVASAARTVMREAKDAGVWVFGAGIFPADEVTVVDTDGSATDGRAPGRDSYIGGFSIVDVPSREEALRWGEKLAVACRCAQEVRELMPDDEG